MANTYFSFKQFKVHQDRCAMKVTTDGCLFGAWCAAEIRNEKKKTETALDIGTGTGLLSLMIAQKNIIYIDAVEINAPASEQARDNIAASPFKNAIKVFNKDITDFEKEGYDVIVSNPPFYENELAATASEKNTAHHSQHLKWETLFAIIAKKLTADGCFFLLIPYKRKKDLELLLEQKHLFATTLILVKQSVQHSPFRIMVKGSKKNTEINTKEIAVCDENKNYTSEFTHLLKEYYLHL